MEDSLFQIKCVTSCNKIYNKAHSGKLWVKKVLAQNDFIDLLAELDHFKKIIVNVVLLFFD